MSWLHGHFASALYCINIWYPYDILLCDMIGPTKERKKKCKACTVHELPAWTLCLCIILHKHMISIWYSVMGYDRSNKRKKEKNVRRAQCMSCLHGPFASALYCINIWYPYDILLWDMIGPTKEKEKNVRHAQCMSFVHGPFASALYCINIWYPYDILLWDMIGLTKERGKKCKACTVHELPAWTLCLCIILHKHMISIWYSVMGYDRSNKRKKEKM